MTLRSVGIVVAMVTEARALSPQTPQPDRLVPLSGGCGMWLSGMGQDAARAGAKALLDAGATSLAVFGVAGALTTDLHSGDLLCPERVVDEYGHSYSADPVWRRSLLQQLPMMTSTPKNGDLLSLSEPLLTPASKLAAGKHYAAAAVDMESAAVAALATERGTPFLVLRAIVDECGDLVPSALHDVVDRWGRPRPLALITALLRHPQLLLQLPGLSSRMNKATRALRAAALAVGPPLSLPNGALSEPQVHA